jgi:hypothetical protein
MLFFETTSSDEVAVTKDGKVLGWLRAWGDDDWRFVPADGPEPTTPGLPYDVAKALVDDMVEWFENVYKK